MRISKLMSFVLMASIATAATTASATSSCNARSGVPRQGNTNPPTKTVKSSASAKQTKAGSSSTRHGRK